MGIFSGARAEHYSTEARRYVQRGEWLMAISFFRKGLEEAPNRATCHYNLGLCLMQAFQFEAVSGVEVITEAIKHFRNALLLEINYPAAWCLFGKATALLVQWARLAASADEDRFEDLEKIAAAASMASVLLLEKKRGPVREAAVDVLIEIAMRRGYTSAENLARFQSAVDLARFQLDAADWLFALLPWVLGMQRDEFFRRFKKAVKQASGARAPCATAVL